MILTVAQDQSIKPQLQVNIEYEESLQTEVNKTETLRN